MPEVGVRTAARLLTEVPGNDFATACHLAAYPLVDAVGPTGGDESNELKKKTIYSVTTGLPTATQELTDSGDVNSTISTTYDLWGRATSYTNSLGDSSTTDYVPLGSLGAGEVAKTIDNTGSTPYVVDYHYSGADANGITDNRGLLTEMIVSNVGTYKAAYDDLGAIVLQTAPAGVSETKSYDPSSGQLIQQTYRGTNSSGTPVDWLTWSRQYDITGRVVNESAPINGSVTSGTNPVIHFDYDRAGRLVKAQDYSAGGGCVTRDYTFDVRGNRTSLVTTEPESGDVCGGDTTTTKSWTYDLSSRARTSGASTYAYDTLGRTTNLPAVDTTNSTAGDITLENFDSDLPRKITQGAATPSTAKSTEFTLDPASRRLTETNKTGASHTSTLTRHYTDGSDNPSWIVKVENGATITSRYTSALDSGLGAITEKIGTGTPTLSLSLDNPHGDLVATVIVPVIGDATGTSAYQGFDEYGNSFSATLSTGAAKYGWVGSAERALLDQGLVLMGMRIYNASAGRFSSLDPVAGGTENAYNYPNDPVGLADLDGQRTADPSGCGSTYRSARCKAALRKSAEAGDQLLLIGLDVGAALFLKKGGNFASKALKPVLKAMREGGLRSGNEIRYGSRFRVGLGNRNAQGSAKLPHYHRRGVDRDGNTIPGQGIGRHRPMDQRSTDKSWRDRW
jgi:RHS repeat-associated protein